MAEEDRKNPINDDGSLSSSLSMAEGDNVDDGGRDSKEALKARILKHGVFFVELRELSDNNLGSIFIFF